MSSEEVHYNLRITVEKVTKSEHPKKSSTTGRGLIPSNDDLPDKTSVRELVKLSMQDNDLEDIIRKGRKCLDLALPLPETRGIDVGH